MWADGDRTVSDVTLERYRLNELPAEAAKRVEQRLQHDPALRDRLDALVRSDDEMRVTDRLSLIAVGVRSRLAVAPAIRSSGLNNWMPRWAVVTTLAALALLVLVVPLIPSLIEQDDERIKGQPALALFRQVGGGSEQLADGAVAHQGDVIRVGYQSAGRRYGVILSVDGRGHVTQHLPTSGEQAAPLAGGGTSLLDQAFELDDAPRWERFYFVTSETPFMVAPVVNSARRAAVQTSSETPARLALADGLDQTVFSLQKESRP
jgi:hypothetical protein